MKDALLYWPRFFREAWINRKYYKAVKSIEAELNAENLRVDWIGRIYGVMEIKEEFANQPEMVQQSIVFQQLSPINELLMKYGLSDLSYPDIRKIQGTNQFLVILYPENDYFNLTSFIRNVLFAGILGVLGFIINWAVTLFM
jgi:acid stress-induced BolA-like protein IbaG/YrbA